jgi:hypothetical protein
MSIHKARGMPHVALQVVEHALGGDELRPLVDDARAGVLAG